MNVYDWAMGAGWYATLTDDTKLALVVVPLLIFAAAIVVVTAIVAERKTT